MRNYEPELQRIRLALAKAAELAKSFSPQSVAVRTKGASGPVTEADLAIDRLLFQSLVCDGEGWLSEETVDDLTRLGTSRVWIVDPIDGTREFLAGLPEWSVSVAFVEHGVVAAAGILNPWADQLFLGAKGQGVTMNGKSVAVSQTEKMEGARVLASRSELRRGLWSQLGTGRFEVIPTGSIAYKLALVASGLAEATLSLAPKHEWDIAAGVGLVEFAGGMATDLNGESLRFNARDPWCNGLICSGPKLFPSFSEIGRLPSW